MNSIHAGKLAPLAFCASVGLFSMAIADMAHAQSSAEADASKAGDAKTSFEEAPTVIVTARRRNERLLEVPATVSVTTGEELVSRGVTDLEGFARQVPQLFLASSSGSFQGGAIGLRGISAGDGNAFGDQAVAFNLDGVQVARSMPRKLATFDLEAIQVLKGPQALYFGKNSPGGIVVLRTADPKYYRESGVRASYEANAQEWRGEAYVSGPIADGWGARVAVSLTSMRGWVTNIVTPGTPYSNAPESTPNGDEIGARVTLKYDREGPFAARYKFNYSKVTSDGIFDNTQRVYCPLGVGQLAPSDDCRADDHVTHSSLGTRFGSGGANTVTGAPIAGVYVFGDGSPFSRVEQHLSGLELNYKLSGSFSIASTTGYYNGRSTAQGNASQSDSTFPYNPARGAASVSGILASYGDVGVREASQELRLTSELDGPLNFMLGGYYQDQKLFYVAAGAFNGLNPVQIFPPLTITQDGTAYSFFGSFSYKPTQSVELSGGARYSNEKKTIGFFRLLPGTLPASQGGAAYGAGQAVPTIVPQRSFNNVSPEATISWRPSNRVTTFISWKRGFLSGGFNPGGTGTNVAVIPDRSYDEETVEGFETGLKTEAFNGALRANLAAFDYKINGLQVTVALPGPPVTQIITNAATARSKGVEADFNWKALHDLSLRGGIAYNRARYTSFASSPCYGGQTIALGCNGSFNGTVFTTQDLSGEQIVRAPEWAGSIGASYDMALPSGNEFGVALDGNYTRSYFTDTLNSPGALQRGYWLLDASMHYAMAKGVEVALIGRNLTDKYYFQRSSAVPGTGGPSGVATSFQPDQSAYVSRGREIMMQATFRFR